MGMGEGSWPGREGSPGSLCPSVCHPTPRRSAGHTTLPEAPCDTAANRPGQAAWRGGGGALGPRSLNQLLWTIPAWARLLLLGGSSLFWELLGRQARMLGFPENLPCLLLPGTAVSWELVPLGEGRLPLRAVQKGTHFSKQDQKRIRERHPAAVDLARFLSPENAESACEGAAAPSRPPHTLTGTGPSQGQGTSITAAESVAAQVCALGCPCHPWE